MNRSLTTRTQKNVSVESYLTYRDNRWSRTLTSTTVIPLSARRTRRQTFPFISCTRGCGNRRGGSREGRPCRSWGGGWWADAGGSLGRCLEWRGHPGWAAGRCGRCLRRLTSVTPPSLLCPGSRTSRWRRTRARRKRIRRDRDDGMSEEREEIYWTKKSVDAGWWAW